MIRIVRFLVAVIALDERGQRAVDATLADWRYELSCATTTGRKLLINLRSPIGVARSLANAGAAEFRSSLTGPFARRVAVMSVLWTLWMLKDGVPGDTDRFFPVASQAEAWTLVAAALIPQLLVVLPLMIFLAEAVGRRHRVTPVVGTALLLAAVLLVIGVVVMPASAVHLKHETWRYFANASVPEPTISVLFVSALSVFPTMLAIVGAWLLFVFANGVRRVGGVTGWAIGLGPVVAAYFVLVLARVLAGAILRIPTLRYDVLIALSLSGPLFTLAAILWATHRLAKISVARSIASVGAAETSVFK